MLQQSNVNLYSALRKQKYFYAFAMFRIAFSLICLFLYFAYFKTVLGSDLELYSVIVLILFIVAYIIIQIFM
ncbi:hypothetical protein A9239_01715 [Methanosarcina sp. A14]|nr:hypothetical protein A9239_01715 [Methanosarcina sp. A14]